MSMTRDFGFGLSCKDNGLNPVSKPFIRPQGQTKKERNIKAQAPKGSMRERVSKILTKKLTWAGPGWPGSNPGLAQVKP